MSPDREDPRQRAGGRGWTVAFAVLAALSFAGPAAAQYLTSGSPPPGAGASSSSMPGWMVEIVRWIVAMQERFYDGLAARIREVRDGGAVGPAAAVIGLSFLYGVFHAAGPGHGKAVVASYFVAHRSRYWRGATMGLSIAAVQGLSAIVIVLGLGAILGLSRAEMLQNWPVLEMASYGLIVALGLIMLFGVVTGRGCGHEDHDEAGDHAHHDHAHHGHARHDHGHAHRHDAPARRRPFLGTGVLPIAVAVGLRPCTGALIVLLFAMANGLLLLGVAGVAAMAAGVALTISLIGMGVIGARRGIVAVVGVRPRAGVVARTGLQLFGSLLVLGIGILLFMGSWHRTATPLF